MARSSEENGEPIRGTQGSEGATGVMELREGNTSGTLCSVDVSTRLTQIAELSRRDRARAFSSLHHVIDEAWLRVAFGDTRKDGAKGVDGEGAVQDRKSVV